MRVLFLKTKFLIIFCVLFFIMTTPAKNALAISEDEKAVRAFKFAKGLFDMEKYGDSAAEFQKFLSFYEKNKYAEYAYYLLGESLYKNGDYQKALDKYEQFIKKYPESKLTDDVYYSAGYTAIALNDNSKAADYFQKIYNSARPEIKKDAIFKYAKINIETKKIDEAKKAFEDYLKETGNDASKLEDDEKSRLKEALYLMGNIFLKEKNEKRAEEYYNDFLKNFENDVLAVAVFYNTGEMKYAGGNIKDAQKNYQKALAILNSAAAQTDEGKAMASYIPKINYSAGWCSYSSGDYKSAIENFKTCYDKHKDFENWADAALRLGVCYFNTKKFKEAEDIFKAVKNSKKLKGKQSGEADYYLALTLQKNGLQSNALEHFEKLSNDTSEIGSEAAYMAAVILFDQKKYDEAIKKFEEFTKKFEKSARTPYAAFNIGLSYFNLNKFKEADASFVAFLKNYPSSGLIKRAWFNLGDIALKLKNYDDALIWFSKITETDSSWLEAQLKICDVYILNKNTEKLTAKISDILKKIDAKAALENESLIPALFKMGKTLAAYGKNDEAENVYEKITFFSKSPRNIFDAKFKIGQINYLKKNYQKAETTLNSIISAAASGNLYNIFEARELYGCVLIEMQRQDEAVKIFNDIITNENSPEHVKTKARIGKAQALASKKSYPEAIELLENLASDVQDIELLAGVQYELAKCYKESGKIDEAIKNLLKIEILFKETEKIDDARIALLELYIKTNNKKDAKNIKDEIMKSKAPKNIKDRAKEILK